MRVAFTIILNGKHHLEHNNYAEYLLDNCLDYWVIVEGASLSNGSTAWCNDMPIDNHINGSSIDGTVEYLKNLETKYNNLKVIYADKPYDSKDTQVNTAIKAIKEKYTQCFLWEIDSDEQWTLNDMILSEDELIRKNGKCGNFSCNLFVGENLIVKGEWGEHNYYRLWNWNGEVFLTHEPPILENNNPVVKMTPRFNHYSYYFEKDVLFKSKWYGGHQDVHENWMILKDTPRESFPLHIKHLMLGCHPYNSFIHYID